MGNPVGKKISSGNTYDKSSYTCKYFYYLVSESKYKTNTIF